jgi:predicted kinase
VARIHLIEGPVGAGKSTFAAQLHERHAAPRLILDDWMATLFRPDRPGSGVMEWYGERKDRSIDQIWKVACDIVEAGHDVVLELGLVQQSLRQQFYDRVDAAGYDLTVYVLDASREARRDRVRQRNRDKGDTYSMDVPDVFFEIASDMWQPLDDWECEDRDVRFIRTDD